jgi:uncharacterized membrane protein
MIRARTILAITVLAGLALTPRCATRENRPQGAAPADMAAQTDMDMTAETGMDMMAEADAAAPAPAVAKTASGDPFLDTVRPVLSARCGKCHDPGGKMHAKLPFDDATVVSSHSAGIVRRLKGEDRAALEKWLAGLAPAAAER